MFGDILGVEQLEPARDQPRHQMHQRHFRRVAGTVKHAFAEEGASQADAIEAACEVAVLPDLDAVAVPELVEPDIEIPDALVDPGVVAAGLRRRAAGDDRLEGGIDGHTEGIRAHGAGQPRGDAETIQRNHAAHFRLDPEQRRVTGALGHREDAAGIGPQQHFGGDLGNGGLVRCHERQNSRTARAYATLPKKRRRPESGRRGGKEGRVKITWKTVAPLLVWLARYLVPVPAGLNANQWHYFAIFAAVIAGLI